MVNYKALGVIIMLACFAASMAVWSLAIDGCQKKTGPSKKDIELIKSLNGA